MLKIRLISSALALLPMILSLNGLYEGWISPPGQRPVSRTTQPRRFWSIIGIYVLASAAVIVGVWML